MKYFIFAVRCICLQSLVMLPAKYSWLPIGILVASWNDGKDNV